MGFNSALSYTTGNWTVTDLTTDTVTTPKTLTISDLDFAHDFVKTEESATEAKLANITGSALGSPETIRFAKSDVKNVYSNTPISLSNQMPVKTGVRTLVEVNTFIQATNGVSGEEYQIPIRAWTCVQVPTASIISDTVLTYAIGRAIGAMFNTGSVDISRIASVARGSLLP